MNVIESTLLERLLRPAGITTHVQPIVAIRNGEAVVEALECLSRGPRDTNAHRADVLFEYVRRKRAEVKVDRVCVATALRSVAHVGELAISFNVHATTLANDREFVAHVVAGAATAGLELHRLIVEINEHEAAADRRGLFESLDALRTLGIRIALDDVGAGSSNYGMMLDARPDVFKVDRFIVHGCARDERRLAIIISARELAARFDAILIAEGVELAEDRDALLAAGVDRMQGYLFSPPVPAEEWR